MKSKLELLQQFKKANKGYKLKLAQKAGYTSSEAYLQYLNIPTSVPSPSLPKSTKRRLPKAHIKQTIHIVNILDASGSMNGGKYLNSCDGIRAELIELRNNREVNYTYTFIEFVDSSKIMTHHLLSELPTSIGFYGAEGHNTPLYNTVYNSLLRVSAAVPTTDKVLVKVYTDGGDNALMGFSKKAGNLIKTLEKRSITTTFVATERDMPKIIRALSLEESNTLAVQDSAQGFERAFEASRGATMSYSSRVASGASGQALTKGFYKKVGKL